MKYLKYTIHGSSRDSHFQVVLPVGIVVLLPGQDAGILATGNFDLRGLSICCRGNFHREKNTVEGWQRLKRLWSQHRKWEMFFLLDLFEEFFKKIQKQKRSIKKNNVRCGSSTPLSCFLGTFLWVRQGKSILMYIFGRSNPKWIIFHLPRYGVGMIKKTSLEILYIDPEGKILTFVQILLARRWVGSGSFCFTKS